MPATRDTTVPDGRKIAVYPGTFDPITNGHLDIVRRASLLFDELVVAAYDTPPKNVIFTTDERVQMIADVTRDIPNVRVDRFQGLLVDYLRKLGARIIVRGLRAVSDFEYEFQMAHMHRQLSPDVEVVCLITGAEYAYLSSSLLKEVASLGASAARFVPAVIVERLNARLRERRVGP